MVSFKKVSYKQQTKYIASDFVWTNPIIASEVKRGPESVKKIASAVIEVMPDRQITHDDTIDKGDKVMIRQIMTGTTKKVTQVNRGTVDEAGTIDR